MRKLNVWTVLMIAFLPIFDISCDKIVQGDEEPACSANNGNNNGPCYNLNVILYEKGIGKGFIKFRQDPDPAKIVTLGTWVEHLQPNHEYLLQRAVDAINVVDGVCTSTSWLTLGKGLTSQSIFTDSHGNGQEELWRDLSSVPTGSAFDIHFQVVDAVSNVVVLTSDCYQYTLR